MLRLRTRHVVAHHVRPVLPVRPRLVALEADVLAGVEHDGDRQRVIFPDEAHEVRPVLLAHVGGVDDGELAPLQPRLGDEMEQREGIGCRVEAVLVVLHHAAAGVGGDDLGRLEMPVRERRLAGAGGADQHDQAEVGDGDPHGPPRSKIAICDGAPSASSASPTGSIRAV